MARNRSPNISNERRNKLRDALVQATTPISATQLGRRFGVTRQVIVKDVALLRAEGLPIRSTYLGYVLATSGTVRRVITVRHKPTAVEEELTLIVEHGGAIIDVQIDHPVYGTVSAPIDVTNMDDIHRFTSDFQPAHALANLTDGIHRHTIEAPDASTLDQVERALDDAGYLYMD